MSSLLQTTHVMVTAEESKSLLDYEDVIGPDVGSNGRFLLLDGQRAYYLGTPCDTCPLLFERLEGAERKISPVEVSSRLRQGLEAVDADLLHSLRPVMPAGSYQVSLLRAIPQLVHRGSPDDYFSSEQLRVWGGAMYWFLPHDPKTDYYRCASQALSATDWFFEFIVPLLPFDRLQTETLTHYARRLAHAEQPTALVLSLLDIREPAMGSQDPLIRRHWCLIHYVLDGHHKLNAAASAGRPMTLLSFLNYNWSSSDVLPILDVLAGHPRDPSSYEE